MRLRPRPLTLRGFVLLLIGIGLFAVADGFSLGVLEEDRANYGRVSPGSSPSGSAPPGKTVRVQACRLMAVLRRLA
jgi:hypothetical protein